MKKKLKFSEDNYKTASKIVGKLKENGFEAYFVGGCVRDAILGLEPDEIDITTNAEHSEVRALFSHTVAIGESFGVVLVIEEGNHFEVATFRSEDEYVDGRHPEKVSYSKSKLS